MLRDNPRNTAPRRVHLLGGKGWTVMLTRDGCGFSRWRGLAVSRWREDGPVDENGSFLLLRDIDTGTCWSAGAQPLMTGQNSDCSVAFLPGLARFSRNESGIRSVVDIAPLPEGDGELRRITLANTGPAPRRVEAVSYIPLVLGAAVADAAHPAFSKMFVMTEADADGTLLAWRRRRDPGEPAIIAAHLVTDGADDGAAPADCGFETDRMRFIGRGSSLRAPAALRGAAPVGHAGTVLDPIFSHRATVTLAPDESRTLDFWTLAAASREDLSARIMSCRTPGRAEAVLVAARQQSEAEDEPAFQTLAAPLLVDNPLWRADAETLERAGGGARHCLWPHGVSGDRPVVLVRFGPGDDTSGDTGLMTQLCRAQNWWTCRQIPVDLVAVAADEDQRTALAERAGTAPEGTGIFVLAGISDAEWTGLSAAARVVLDGAHGDLAAQCARRAVHAPPATPQAPEPASPVPAFTGPSPSGAGEPGLACFNGIGGFRDGEEYEIRLEQGRLTPQPWVNIVAHEGFGFMVSAEGGGYAWAGNSQTNTLTRWSNDPVRDPPGDMIFLRDTDDTPGTGFWAPTPAPLHEPRDYTVRHGFGYSRFLHVRDGLESDLVQFVPLDAGAKVSHLRLRNGGDRVRRLQVTGLVNWHLGPNGAVTVPHVTTAHDPETGILTARNRWRDAYAGRVAFADLGGRQRCWTCDRAELLGPALDPARPVALMQGAPLRGRSGTGLCPCAALQTEITLAPGEKTTITFTFGEAEDIEAARALALRLRDADPGALLAAVRAHWRDLTGAVQVETPDGALDLVVNGWLPYQVIACRLLARTAFYQASGAWGFRDQLQDASALAVIAPALARAHLLRAAGRQFPEGDVQHWWLPPEGAGLRTRMVDDRLWLPYVLAHHVCVTGDRALLDEPVPFLDAPPLAAGRIDDFRVPGTGETASVYEHGARAIEASLATGRHGLPLFGTGDWNDGMNRVGWKGAGESVWMGWFLLRVIADFAPLAEARSDTARAATWREHADRVARALEEHAWEGDRWLRGWYDDGTPLGTKEADECRIDAIAQSWAVISGAADPRRARSAMETLDRELIDRDAGLVALLAPPFDMDGHDPGYIKSYPPGLRENGGQYTHGSTWAGVAFAELGDGARAHEVFSMLSPVSHSSTPEALARWQVEPYVACGDVYTAPGHVGRGGWTWYTGSAGWLYRLAVEWILGLRVRGGECVLRPCIPPDWPGFMLTLRRGASSWRFAVENPRHVCTGVAALVLDGTDLDPAGAVPLVDDGGAHQVRVVLG
ncbi:GH36-type glycosyl hydrolase domain-containing protein [Pontibaca methylaminivorans]|uniref:GH36-type glycosyl hydrolase domain-containing protein n=1 Tax=Pontibaca methylaminivorans TaxID=515897 RepID=UPI002FD9B6AD